MLSAAVVAVVGSLASVPAAQAVIKQTLTINGSKVDRFLWKDSAGRNRTISLKREGEGNAGHGGYAVQATYQYLSGGVLKTLIANAPAGDGFGYFVSHERFRDFAAPPKPASDNKSIAFQYFNTSDSPPGRGFAVQAVPLSTTPGKAIIQYITTYPRYGTVAATTRNPNTGGDSPPLPASAAAYKRYNLEVRITWYFQDGTDYPRIRTRVDMSTVPGADRLSFDLRGPYGKLNFDGSLNAPVKQVFWGDRYHFRTSTLPLTRNTPWTWNQANNGARYLALSAQLFEMGLVEPRRYTVSQTKDGYSGGRGKTSATAYGSGGCPSQNQLVPCDYEWPYQASQYELPYDNVNGTTTSKKMAWGSAAYYGTSLAQAYDSPTTFQPLVGFPANKILQYDVCLVLGRTVAGSLTRSVALGGGTYNCADGIR
jgi:hypothetical protein